MVQSYYKYLYDGHMGIIYSPHAPPRYLISDTILIPQLDTVALFSIRQQKTLSLLQHNQEYKKFSNITSLELQRDGKIIVVGYANGRVCLFQQQQQTNQYEMMLCTFGHTSSITCLALNDFVFASGSDDTNICVWDTIGHQQLYKLVGHKGSVTGLAFFKDSKYIISCSKDMLIKIWELNTQHCIQTVIGTRSEIWTMALHPSQTRLLVGCTTTASTTNSEGDDILVWNLEPLQQDIYEKDIQFMGSLHRTSSQQSDRIHTIQFDSTGEYFACHGTENKQIQLFKMRPQEEVQAMLKDSQKQVKKIEKEIQELETQIEKEVEETCKFDQSIDRDELVLQLQQQYKLPQLIAKKNINYAKLEFKLESSISVEEKIRGMDFYNSNFLLLGTLRNSILYSTNLQQFHSTIKGHGTPILDIKISSDNQCIASLSSMELKLWNIKSKSLIKSFPLSHSAQSIAFLPGNKYILIGFQNGSMQLLDVNNGLILFENEKQHMDKIWQMEVKPDRRGLISISSDKMIKFWDFAMSTAATSNPSSLTLALDHTLEMNEDVIALACSPKSKFFAVSLLDCTVKLFYMDSLKFYLSLYGHKLPINSMDISYDEQLIVTASQDKNIKIWGLDFGDCHKSLFAHEESITCVKFQPDTHYFMSCSRDGSVKYWNADTFEMIQQLRPSYRTSPLSHLIWNQNKHQWIASGHERALFLFSQSEEQLFVEEEQERLEEEQLESQMIHQATQQQQQTSRIMTLEVIKQGEEVMQVLEFVSKESEQEYEILIKQYKSKHHYVWNQLLKIAKSDLEHVLSILNYSQTIQLLQHLYQLMHQYKESLQIELVIRIVSVLLQIHSHRFVLDTSQYEWIEILSKEIKKRLFEEKHCIGFNIAALQVVKSRIENEKTLLSVDEIVQVQQEKKRVSKKRKQDQQTKTLTTTNTTTPLLSKKLKTVVPQEEE